ncbi:hypothetical protein R3X25_02575 [Lutibacter sp. TH_r2]|uniref:hypothetical protein n=1 Tax=Lutibacter sp. TH_r2 TaxID=3082083 RepID=UPI002953F385|nr:hypothetical protein [Lutibacter sp. TH_r2]MDV7186153.1 hypothetical protein [Lutibacter sp. TH_r2]
MKNISLQILFIVVLGISTQAQVGIGTTNPEASSMLDIQSTSKGVLIPRMTTLQRGAIATPVNGLLVFDTTTSSFWFYTTSWQELAAESSTNNFVDADGDTKIEVEKTPDIDEINFTTSGTERMKINANGVVIMGDSMSGNYTKVTTDGSLSYEGEATRWDDLKVPMNATNKGSSNQPEWLEFKENGTQGVWLWSFSHNVEEELYFVVQMPHGWKEGSDIYPHVHWTTKVGSSGNVKWALEYTWSNVGDVFSNPTIISSSTITKGDANTAYNHNLTALPIITGTGKTLSSMLVCRVYRDGDDGSDTFNNEVQILELDFHYQIDSDGSNEEYSKW